MAGRFEQKLFSEIDINDPLFDTLKVDYPEFSETWFPKCIRENRKAWVFYDPAGLGAFVALKEENEPITLQDGVIPAVPRLKIATLLLAERFRGQRLGEGALGLILWSWQRSKLDEVYVTVFPSHTDLIAQVERFGFQAVGNNARGEMVYLRSRKDIDFSDPYKSFPFVSPNFDKGGYLIVDDSYHDTLFPYSELKNTPQEVLNIDAANGVSKVYIGKAWNVHYRIGEPIFIYRKYTGNEGKPGYRSCLTSYCVVTEVVPVKENGYAKMSFDEFVALAGNKTIFERQELRQRFDHDRNITVVTMLYCGYFGPGCNLSMMWLKRNGLWAAEQQYPTRVQLTPAQCQVIWRAAQVDVDNALGL